jgi:DNA-binding transcriptional LysR family regulator
VRSDDVPAAIGLRPAPASLSPERTLAGPPPRREADRIMPPPTILRIAVGPTVPLARALAGVVALAGRVPDAGIEVEVTTEAERRLAAGHADAALLRAPVHDPGLSWAVAAREPRVALVVASHPLARATRARMADLAGTEILESDDDALGLGRPVASVDELLTRVAAGRGVAVVPSGLAASLPAAIVAVPLLNAMPSTIVVAHRVAAAPLASAYVDAVVETAAAA